MKNIQRLVTGALSIAFVASVMLSATSADAARARHHTRHHRHFQQTTGQRYYHSSAWLNQEYGTYPNIQYFERNGHVYNKDLDTGQINLVKW